MRHQRIGMFIVIAMSLFSSMGRAAPKWLDNYAEARKIAKRTGKPIFLVFR